MFNERSPSFPASGRHDVRSICAGHMGIAREISDQGVYIDDLGNFSNGGVF